MHRVRLCTLVVLLLAGTHAALLPLTTPAAAGAPAAATDDGQAASPHPPVLSATDLGLVRQHHSMSGRDGAISAAVDGRLVWTFGDTLLRVPNADGEQWVDSSLAWTADLDASDGIILEGNLLDATGVPAEFVPYLPRELAYNDAHDPDDCQGSAVRGEFAFWPGNLVPDPDRDRVLVFYYELWRSPAIAGWRGVGPASGCGMARGRCSGRCWTPPVRRRP